MDLRRFCISAWLISAALAMAAQSSTEHLGGTSDAAQRLFDRGFRSTPDSVWDLASVEQPPEYPGGMAAMYKYIQRQTNYPMDAIRAGQEGKVFVAFVVRKSGVVDHVALLRGVAPSLNDEALRVVRSMPPWAPGRMAGKPVSVRFTVPISFVLGNSVPDLQPDSTR